MGVVISCQASAHETAAMEYQEEMDMEHASVEAEDYVRHRTEEAHHVHCSLLAPYTTSLLLPYNIAR